MSEDLEYSVLAIVTSICALSLVGSLLATAIDCIRYVVERRGAVRRVDGQPSGGTILILVASILTGEIFVLQAYTQPREPITLLSSAGLLFAVGLWQIHSRQSRRVRTPAMVELISVYYSAYVSRPVVVEALKETATAINDARLGRALHGCVNAFYAGCTLEESLDRLGQHVEHPLCARFVSILKAAPNESATTLTEALRLLKERAEEARAL
jgi:hypothetical protein